ncbi:MAG: UDP-N-acetylmuramoyl-L-alanine--D-glutamate ligase [Gammaproteobacteria bacterium]
MVQALGQKVIIGLGKTGLSCLQFLSHQGIPIAVVDSREQPPGLLQLQTQFPRITVHLGKFDEQLLQQAQELIVSPGVSLAEPAIARCVAAGIPVIGDIELFARHVKAPVIAITGTNGKSTVTTLVGKMVRDAGWRVKVGGNLGTPALDLLDGEPADCYVLELSSFQLETTYSLHSHAAVVLNIAPDHLDRYRNMDEYIDAKQRIYTGCQTPVINRDDRVSYRGLPDIAHAIRFTLNEPITPQEFGLRTTSQGLFLAQGAQDLLPVTELQIKGRHHWANALAALALGRAIGLPMSAMLQTLRTFQGLAHRCQWVARYQEVDWYNDSKATNVVSSIAALEGLGDTLRNKLILIAGGLGKQQDFSPLQKPVLQYVRTVILIGRDAPLIEQALNKTSKILHASSMLEAVTLAHQEAQAGDAVLLSPACASFDMFDNFEHRGEVFMTLVRELS